MENPNKKAYDRAVYIRQLQKEIVENIFKDRARKLETEMFLIAEENQALLKTTTNTFMFNGEWFPIKNPPVDCNKRLHPSLRQKVQQLLTEFRQDSNDLIISVEHMIGTILRLAKNTADLYALFPKQLSIVLPVIAYDLFNVEEPMEPDQIEALKEEHANGLKAIKRLLITQLLLAKV